MQYKDNIRSNNIIAIILVLLFMICTNCAERTCWRFNKSQTRDIKEENVFGFFF